MPVRATTLRRFAKQLRSGSSVELRLPFSQLINQFVRRFSSQVLQKLSATSPTPALQGRIRDWNPAAKIADFQAMDDLHLVIPITVTATGSNVRSIANDFEDVAIGEARCLQNDFDDLDTELAERFDRLTSETRAFTQDDLLSDHGPMAAEAFLKLMQRQAEDERDGLRREHESEQRKHWSPSEQAQNRKHADQVRKLAPDPVWWMRLLARLLPWLFSEWLFPKSVQIRVERQLRLVREIQLRRMERAARERVLAQFDRLIGTDGHPGFFSELLLQVRESSSLFTRLEEQCADIPSDRPTTHVLQPVRSIDDIIQRSSGQTLGDHYFRKLAAFGFSPVALAEKLRERGLDCGGRILRPQEWHLADATVLAAAFQLAVSRYLGTDDPQQEIDFATPSRPIEYVASVGLCDPALREVVMLAIPELGKRIRSFAVTRPHPQGKSSPKVFLFCHASQRREWESRLRTYVVPSVTSDDRSSSRSYDFSNPFVLVLVNIETSIAGGLHDGYHRWMLEGNRARLETTVKPLSDRRLLSESRLLSRRETELPYCEMLFKNGLTVGAIKPKGTHFLPKLDARVDVLFQRRDFEPSWQSAEHFQQLLRGTGRGSQLFALVIEERVPGLTNFRHRAAELANEPDVDAVAAELVQLGVLERNASQQYRVTFPHNGKERGLTEFIYAAQPAKLVARTRDDFIALIQRDDDLHDVLFFAVCDAVVSEELAPHDVPSSVREYIATTLKL